MHGGLVIYSPAVRGSKIDEPGHQDGCRED